MAELADMSQRVSARRASAQRAGPRRRALRPPGGPWLRVSWSVPAALRAARATIVIPLLFALTFKVIRNEQMTLFAVFGGFATLVVTSFGGTRRDKAVAHLGLATAGTLAIVLGTLASETAWLAAIVTLPVAFVIYFAGSATPNASAGVTGCLFAFVLPVASSGGTAVLLSRLEGWWLASAVSTAAVLLVVPKMPGDRLRAQCATLAAALADQIDAILTAGATQDGNGAAQPAADAAARQDALVSINSDLMNAFVAAPYRDVGLAAADAGLANLVHLLDWSTSLVGEAAASDLDWPAADAADRDLMDAAAQTLHGVSAVLRGRELSIDISPLWQAQLASARHLDKVSADPADAVRQAERAFRAQAIGIAASAAMGDALIASRLARPAEVTALRRDWIANLPEVRAAGDSSASDITGETTWPGPGKPAVRETLTARLAGLLSTETSLRSVWFRNSVRGAIALAAAVAAARLIDVQHAFWVVLGTLSVLRTNAAATGATALRGLLGTVAGFAVGAALLVGIGVSPVALWIAFPVAVLVAAYTPGTAPFLAGQAAFTVTIVVLFNLLVPAGWRVGLLRVEDVAIGCAVSLVVGYLFWPRGASSVVGDNLAIAFRSGSGYLSDVVSWALGDRPHRPERAADAVAAGSRLDDAVRGYLTEQGSKRLTKADLWALVTAAVRLRITAHSMASLPGRPRPHSDDSGLHAALGQQAGGMAAWYDQLATLVARPGRGTPEPALGPLPASGIAAGPAPCGGRDAYRQDALWVGFHLDRLEASLPDLAGPADRFAQLRRRPWWR
jgi:uncharacterized membrane protein YccC